LLLLFIKGFVAVYPTLVNQFNGVLGERLPRVQDTLSKDLVKSIAAGGGTGVIFLAVANGLLPILGFGAQGIIAGSFAASVMGPAVASGSIFAVLQSAGVIGFSAVASGGILLAGAAVAGAAIGIKTIVKHFEEKEQIRQDDIQAANLLQSDDPITITMPAQWPQICSST